MVSLFLAALFQKRKMKQLNNFFLNLRIQINEQVAATDQVQVGKRRIADQILHGKNHRFTNPLQNVVFCIFPGKIFFQVMRRQICGDGFRVNPLAGRRNSLLVDVRGKNMSEFSRSSWIQHTLPTMAHISEMVYIILIYCTK